MAAAAGGLLAIAVIQLRKHLGARTRSISVRLAELRPERLPTVISATALPTGGDNHPAVTVGGKWTTSARKNVDAKGLAAFTVTPAKKGTYSYRAVSSGTATGAGAPSATITVKAT